MAQKKLNKNKITTITLIIILTLTLTISGCTNTNNTDNKEDKTDKIQAIASIAPQEEIVKEIGGKKLDVTVLVPPGESPHSYDLKPSQLKKISKAEVYFKVGSGVEFELTNMDQIKSQNNDLKIIDLAKGVNIKSWDEHHGKTSETNINKEGTDPHIWLSPINGIKMSENVYNGLIEIDPDNKDYYQQNLNKYREELNNIHKNIKEKLKPYENQSFLVYHPSFGYFGDAYNLTQIGIEEEGKKPGPEGISNIINQAKELNIDVIFVSPQFDTSSAEVIAEEINGKVITANPLAGNYSQTLQNLAEKLEKGLN